MLRIADECEAIADALDTAKEVAGEGMAQGTGYRKAFKITAKSPAEEKPGNGYFGFGCASCKQRGSPNLTLG